MENPGSDKAIELGCTCPVMDNGHGRGNGPFWYSESCPYHVTSAGKNVETFDAHEYNGQTS